MKRLSALTAIGLLAFVLAGPAGAIGKRSCGMACCRLGAPRAACASMSGVVDHCGGGGKVASLPSLPPSVLAAPPALAALAPEAFLASLPAASGLTAPRDLPERPPRA